ncbi:MAG: MarR family winged helix-turn-helix transcriptional regulator [Chloroflexota bacterium]
MKDYNYSYLRNILGHLAALMFVRATDIGMVLLAEIGLTTKESTILEFIGSNPETSQKEIARETGTKQSLLVNILDNLTAKGLLLRERSDVDRRRHCVKLTEAGEGLRQQIKALQTAANNQLIEEAGLTVDEVETLTTLLQKVVSSPILKTMSE